MKKIILVLLCVGMLCGNVWAEDRVGIHQHYKIDCGVCRNYRRIKELHIKIIEGRNKEEKEICPICGVYDGNHIYSCPNHREPNQLPLHKGEK